MNSNEAASRFKTNAGRFPFKLISNCWSVPRTKRDLWRASLLPIHNVWNRRKTSFNENYSSAGFKCSARPSFVSHTEIEGCALILSSFFTILISSEENENSRLKSYSFKCHQTNDFFPSFVARPSSFYGTLLLILSALFVYAGVRFVSKVAPIALVCVILSILSIYGGIFINYEGTPDT